MKTDKGSEQTRLQRCGNGQQARHRHPRGTRRSKPQAASPGVATTGELDTTGAAEPSRAPRVRVGTQPGAASARSSPRLRGGQTKAAPPSGPARPGEPASGHLPKGAQSGTSERPWHTHVRHRHCPGEAKAASVHRVLAAGPRSRTPGRAGGQRQRACAAECHAATDEKTALSRARSRTSRHRAQQSARYEGQRPQDSSRGSI